MNNRMISHEDTKAQKDQEELPRIVVNVHPECTLRLGPDASDLSILNDR